MRIETNSVVAIHYTMRNSKGEVLADTMHGAAVNYLHGGAAIDRRLQEPLEGLCIGDKRTVFLKAEAALMQEDFCFEVSVAGVRPALQQEILMGYPIQADQPQCDENCACT